ncbi:hypothetical protein BDV93DRAFT_606093 [Ceratobasidium sp. AG-I]|nr:hypothetical protein BDV93DRAFT_606093 [Ceratobasidium sp. AG-I]
MSLSVRSRVWDIPELVKLISSWLPRHDCVHLAYTSRSCFEGAIGFVWYKVRGANNILVMLPETEGSVESDHGDGRVELKIGDLETSDLGRFHFYSPFIKHLEIREPENRRYHASAWDTLLSCSSAHPLLPNLEHLMINHDSRVVSDNLFLWLILFLSPKLKSLKTWSHMGRHPPYVSSSELAEFVSLVVQRCPMLETLALPHDTGDIRSEDGTIMPNLGDKALEYQYLIHAQNLVSLTADRSALDPAPLRFIGRLPQLKTLNLYARIYPNPLIITLNLELGLFPALKHLFVEVSDFSELKELWRMKQLVQGLSSVEAHLGWGVYSLALPFVFLDFGHVSPHIDTLTIENPGTTFMAPLELRSLSKLSLHTLNFSGFEFGSPLAFCQILGESVPLLTHLQVLGWTLALRELVWFSKLPELNNLALAIDWWPGPPLMEEIQPCRKLRILECNPPPSIGLSDQLRLGHISRFILMVAPNIMLVEPLPELRGGKGHQGLNDSIGRLREDSTNRPPSAMIWEDELA